MQQTSALFFNRRARPEELAGLSIQLRHFDRSSPLFLAKQGIKMSGAVRDIGTSGLGQEPAMALENWSWRRGFCIQARTG